MRDFDEVESVLLRNVLLEMMKYKIYIGILMIVLSVIGGSVGFRQSKALPKTSDGAEVIVYEQTLQKYDEQLQKLEESIRLTEQQLSMQQEYLKKSQNQNSLNDSTFELKNKQTEQINLLRRFNDDINKYKSQIIDVNKQKNVYAKTYKPKKYHLKNPTQIAAKYAAVGAMFALVISFVFLTIRRFTNGKINDVETVLGLDIPVLSVVESETFKPSFERSITEIILMVNKNQAESICMDPLDCDLKEVKILLHKYSSELDRNNIKSFICGNIDENSEELKQFVEIGKSIVFVKLGETSAKRLKDYLKLCQKFDVDIWGFIVIV